MYYLESKPVPVTNIEGQDLISNVHSLLLHTTKELNNQLNWIKKKSAEQNKQVSWGLSKELKQFESQFIISFALGTGR